MTLETASFAGGAIEVTFLQQQGLDPFTATPERTAQIRDVATRLGHFIGEAKSTIDIAIYDFRLRDEAATIVADGLRSQARKVFAHGLPMTAPQPRTRTPYPPPPHRKSSLTKGQLEPTPSFVHLPTSRRSKVLPATES